VTDVDASDGSTDEITRSVTCDSCGEETFAFERECVKCGVNRWESQSENRERTPIAREHLLGATVWAYGGGGVDIKPWTTASSLRMPARLNR
jgi:ribosomal protein L37E